MSKAAMISPNAMIQKELVIAPNRPRDLLIETCIN
jgi:hypothetical protein